MPWNKDGEWCSIQDPVEHYKDIVIRCSQQPGAAGALWNETTRKELHDAAARHRLKMLGIPETPQSLEVERRKLEIELGEHSQCDEENAWSPKPTIPPVENAQKCPLNKHEGD